ncbi:alpha/beta hydrolase [Candidatus Gottesmanbacteria bacterium]|nr:alpha/beta hydrolase [Candidatus Gottesmanbacteria bacterium]
MQNISPQKIRIDGIFLNFVTVGYGSPIILIHGWTNNWKGWLPLAEHLKKNNKLYLIDLPGYGDSGDLHTYTLKKQSFYIADFIKLLNLAPVVVMGFSMGTFVASMTAKNFPELVKSLILIGPPLKKGTNFSANSLLRKTLRSLDKTVFTQKILRRIVVSKKFAYFMAKYMNMYKFDKTLVDTYGTEGKKKMRISAFIDMGVEFSSTSLEEIVGSLHIPTLLIYGKEDKVAPPQYARPLENGNLQISIIPEAGHMTFWEKPKEVANSINIFLRKSSES